MESCRHVSTSNRRSHVYITLFLAALVMGCASTGQIPAGGDVGSAPDSMRLRDGIEIVGYVTDDGVYHSFRGTARLEDQSWHFVRLPVWGQPGADVTVSRGTVRSLKVEKGTYRNPMAGTAAIAIMIASVLAVLSAVALSVHGYN